MLELRTALTAHVGGVASEVVEPGDVDTLVRTIGELRARGRSFRILGGGSNIVAADGRLEEPIVRMTGLKRWERLSDHLWRVEAGVALARIVHESARRGLSGLECCAGVPGTLGAAIRINAGGKWGTISGVLREVTLLKVDGRIVRQPVTPADFTYRRSSFWDDVVLEAKLEFASAAAAVKPGDRIREVLHHKKATQPLIFPSAGCIFRNPSPANPAGRLIEQAGLKGTRVGGALVSDLHANYIVNAASATGSDFLDLIDIVRRRVREKSGVELELEIEIWR